MATRGKRFVTRPRVLDLEVVERSGVLTILVDLPAMRLEEVSIKVTDEYVTVEGKRAPAESPANDSTAPQAIEGRFSRSVRLPHHANAAAVTWTFDAGVLQIMIPLLDQDLLNPTSWPAAHSC